MDNLTSACGWMAMGMRWRTAKPSTFAIHTGRGMLDNLNAVLDGTVDIALTTPGVNATMALQGLGPYAEPHPQVRAIAALPHRDRLLLGISVEASDRYGVRSLPELVAKRPPLRIATGINDGINMIGYTVEKIRALRSAEAYLIFPQTDFARQATIFGEDPYPSGIAANHTILDMLIEQRLPVNELFADLL